MPVTSKKLLLLNISQAGKKAPNNLRYDSIKKQIVNPKCDCKPPPLCIGTYPTGQFFGDAVCNGSTCYASIITATTGPQVLVIPGTTYTLQPNVNLFMVNCSTSNVYWKNNYDVLTPTLILPGNAAIHRPNILTPVIYTFTSS
jgi:hypothetical protein